MCTIFPWINHFLLKGTRRGNTVESSFANTSGGKFRGRKRNGEDFLILEHETSRREEYSFCRKKYTRIFDDQFMRLLFCNNFRISVKFV